MVSPEKLKQLQEKAKQRHKVKTFYTSKIRKWSSHSYCKLNNGLEPFKHLYISTHI